MDKWRWLLSRQASGACSAGRLNPTSALVCPCNSTGYDAVLLGCQRLPMYWLVGTRVALIATPALIAVQRLPHHACVQAVHWTGPPVRRSRLRSSGQAGRQPIRVAGSLGGLGGPAHCVFSGSSPHAAHQPASGPEASGKRRCGGRHSSNGSGSGGGGWDVRGCRSLAAAGNVGAARRGAAARCRHLALSLLTCAAPV